MMDCPCELNVALKEWASVCRALEEGRQMLLLRKGGIYEASGEFEVEHPQFLLFPTYLHQNLKMLKPSEHAGFESMSAEPAQIRLGSFATVEEIIQLQDRSQMDAIEDEHIWTPPLIDMRFSYRPENPLYLLLVRVYAMERPVTIQNTPAYAGCKSWVPLEQAIATASCRAAIDDRSFDDRRRRIRQLVQSNRTR